MLGYEHIFTDFLLSLVQGKRRKVTGSALWIVMTVNDTTLE